MKTKHSKRFRTQEGWSKWAVWDIT